MTRTAVQIDERAQAAKSKEGKYLTFAFLGPDKKMELKAIGWTQFEVQPSKSGYTSGIVHLWGCKIPVKGPKILQGRDTAEMTDTSCIIIFEFSEYYLGMVVNAISNVMILAEKDPETVAVVETQIVDELGCGKVQYNIVERANELV